MKIAFASTVMNFPLGGADTLWSHAAEAALARQHQLLVNVSLAVSAHPRIEALRGKGAAISPREPTQVPRTLPARVARKLGWTRDEDGHLAASLRSFAPDLLIISLGGTYDLVLYPQVVRWLLSSGVRFRLIANWQAERPDLDAACRELMRRLLPAADLVYFVSTSNLEATRRHLGLPLPNGRVIQNPLRWRESHRSPWPARPEARLATVSRLESDKGIQVLLEALAAVGDSAPAWRLGVYGLGPYEAELRALAGRLGQAARVDFRGYVPDLRAIWAENHLMVSPALEDGVPMTIPEAMFCERPVLATRVGGAEDWIRDDETGFLCAPADIAALAAALRRAFAARERWPAMGRAAAAAAAARYAPEDYLKLIAS